MEGVGATGPSTMSRFDAVVSCYLPAPPVPAPAYCAGASHPDIVLQVSDSIAVFADYVRTPMLFLVR